MAQTHHLSQKAFDRLKAEHDELTTVGRVDIARKIEAARELGDLKENGDYHAAKDFQGQMEARIRQLAGMIENGEIVEGTDGDIVEPGSIVAAALRGRRRRRDVLLRLRRGARHRARHHQPALPARRGPRGQEGRRQGRLRVTHRRPAHRRGRHHQLTTAAAGGSGVGQADLLLLVPGRGWRQQAHPAERPPHAARAAR